MLDKQLLKRVAVNPESFGGKPIIRGMRIAVELILSLLAQGETQGGPVYRELSNELTRRRYPELRAFAFPIDDDQTVLAQALVLPAEEYLAACCLVVNGQ